MSFGLKMAVLWLFIGSFGAFFMGVSAIPSVFSTMDEVDQWTDEHLEILGMAAKGRALERDFLAAAREIRDLGVDGRPLNLRAVDELLSRMEENRKKIKAWVKDAPGSRTARTFVGLSEKLVVYIALARVLTDNPGLAEERGRLKALEIDLDESLAELNSLLDESFRRHTTTGPPEYALKIWRGMLFCLMIMGLFASVGTLVVYAGTAHHCNRKYMKMMNEMEKAYEKLDGEGKGGIKPIRNDDDFFDF